MTTPIEAQLDEVFDTKLPENCGCMSSRNHRDICLKEAKKELINLIAHLASEAKPEITFDKSGEGIPNTLAVDFAIRHLDTYHQNLMRLIGRET